MTKRSIILKWALIASIVVIANLFINYSLSLVMVAPEFNDYCDNARAAGLVENEMQCLERGGEWQEYAQKVPDGASGYCDLYSTCSAEYEEVRADYERNIFITLVTIGVVLFVSSLFLKSNYVVSVAVSLAAVLNFVIASMRYWSTAENVTRVVILALALAILVYLAYKKFSDE